MSYEKVFTPGKIGSVELKNRVVMTPMGVDVAELDGAPGERWSDYYEERAKGGVGLIITEITRVNDGSAITLPRQLSMAKDANIEPLSKVVDKIHSHGTKIFVQLHHAGRQNTGFLPMGLGPAQLLMRVAPEAKNLVEKSGDLLAKVKDTGMLDDPKMQKIMRYMTIPNVSASAVRLADNSQAGSPGELVRPLTIPEIKLLEKKFGKAALRVKKAGADGVEIHSAHGYLVQQFLSPYTNHRKDMYGGSLKNRMRFLLNIIREIRKQCGPDFPIVVRLTVEEFFDTQGMPNTGIQLDEGVEMARRLERAGVDAIDVSCGNYETGNTIIETMRYPQGWRRYFVKAVKDAVSIPVIGVGVIREPDFAEELLEDGIQDFVGLGRPLLADPHWVKKAETGRVKEIQRCICCVACFESLEENAYSFKPAQCALNPRCCNELFYNEKTLPKDGNGRQIVVIGAGPGGLTAARELAEREFKVVVLEKENEVGGQLNIANKPPQKDKMNWATEDLTTRAIAAGAEIRTGVSVSEEMLAELNPYAVIVATGASSKVPDSIPGAGKPHVMTAADALRQELDVHGKNVVVVGSGLTGLETAEYFGSRENNVTVVEMMDVIGPGMYRQHFQELYRILNGYGTRFLPGAKLTEILDKTVRVEGKTGSIAEPLADYVVFATGVRSNNELVETAKKVCSKVYSIGDAAKTGTILDATSSAMKIAYELH